MAFTKKLLEVTVSLAPSGSNTQQPKFEGGGNTVTLSGLRMSAHISKAGGPSDSKMELTIYGMTESKMNQLSTLGMQINLVPKNSIVLQAGDEDGLSTVFQGYILSAYADFSASPQVSFKISAHTGLPDATVPTPVSSIKGSGDVATLLSGLAATMGLAFENSGVTAKLSNPYYTGSPKVQAQAIAKDAGISMIIDNGKLAIWPKNGTRNGQVPLISPQTGMIGYPTYTAYGIMLKCLFNPSIGFGQKINVESRLKPACGEWSIYGMDYDLECLTPKGKWEITLLAYNPKYPTPVQR
jgi:hypothetical protein